ncbi:hypothetical protein ACFWVF_36905 [Streptomyces sp. NPDC058659]|uniref:hypothetical protein n=1 Tax=unclassified Streptomyces TaxID=2593676 RepID=UPI00365A346C
MYAIAGASPARATSSTPEPLEGPELVRVQPASNPARSVDGGGPGAGPGRRIVA